MDAGELQGWARLRGVGPVEESGSARGPVLGTWLLYGAVLVATVVTYWRLGPGETYHFDDTGASGALSRSLTYLSFPVALAAVALLWAVGRGWLTWVATLLCALVVLPGFVTPDDLEAKWWHVLPALGVALAVGLTVTRAPERAERLGIWRLALLGLLAVASLPWLTAAVGVHADDVPLLGDVFRSSEPTPGEPGLPSVHLGLHEGLFGVQLAVTALVLSTVRPLRRGLAPYLALMLCYGLMVFAKDGWNEQVVKRGWSDTQLPDVLQPALSWGWLGVIAAAALVYVLWFGPRRERA